jgi:hypothetical protein
VHINELFYNEKPSGAWEAIAKLNRTRVGEFTLRVIEEAAILMGWNRLQLWDDMTVVNRPGCEGVIKSSIYNTLKHKTSLYEEMGYYIRGTRALRERNNIFRYGNKKICQDKKVLHKHADIKDACAMKL